MGVWILEKGKRVPKDQMLRKKSSPPEGAKKALPKKVAPAPPKPKKALPPKPKKALPIPKKVVAKVAPAVPKPKPINYKKSRAEERRERRARAKGKINPRTTQEFDKEVGSGISVDNMVRGRRSRGKQKNLFDF
ncbi:MAG: hypothetical protein OTJ97_05120 [SAR202 cluster bacterium]|nr:hypothetical protein [SAR202 cluster bacterium]